MKILSITISKPSGDQTFDLDAFLMNKDETKSDISVTKITTFLRTVKIYFSDDRVFIFKGFPFILIKK